MKTQLSFVYGGSLVLLACMVFAFVRLDTADSWIALWRPFVAAGVFLVFLGIIIGASRDRSRRVGRRHQRWEKLS